MNLIKSLLIFISLFIFRVVSAQALVPVLKADTTIIERQDKQTKYRLRLTLIVNDPNFNPQTRHRLIDAYFTVYPKEIDRFNQHAVKDVVFCVDTAYKGVAATSNAYVRFNPQWFVKHPDDIDVVTHEVMHIVQAYGNNAVPGWLTEGIADYARYKFGIDNEKANWKLTAYSSSQNYTNAYRVTARFLAWVEMRKNKNVVDQMDKAMRLGQYNIDLWTKLTGETIEELWKEYGENPTI
jgi:hypothetical protein